MLLHHLILDRVASHGSNTALVRSDETLTYADLAEQVSVAASGFSSLGLTAGERVAIYLNKRIECVVAYFSVSMAGGVFVPVNPVLKPAQVQHILNDCACTVLITTAAQAQGLEEALNGCRSLRHIVTIDDKQGDLTVPHVEKLDWSGFMTGGSGSRKFADRIDNDVAAILYTSGSTGKPKGVVLSHRNMTNGAVSVASYLENTADDTILAVLPFSFDAGFSQMTTGFSVGATIALMDYLLPRDVVKAVARHRATGLTGVPPLWNQLATLEWPEDAVNSLRYIANTGGAMPTATLNKLREKLPQTRPFLMYGLTESFRSTYLPPEELDNRPTSIGKAIPDAEILVVREDGSQCSPGEPGELVHRGALVSLGYWNDPERTAQRFRPVPQQMVELPFQEIAVWSGDTVVKDEEGFLYFVGRKDDMIKSSGYRISPTEVEEVIYNTGLVKECAAIGIPHKDLGQAVVIAAHSESSEENSDSKIMHACRTELPNFMVPQKIVWCDALPRNPNGKIDRRRLSEDLEGLFQDDLS